MNVVDDGREKPEGHALQTGFVGKGWEARFELDAMRCDAKAVEGRRATIGPRRNFC
ncbi:hypothetical protein CKAH01_02002 [Colletotrichum kahawae]|uniref:Uncharacterized protein n=1 Tax=Colletotrichum kahawae TaxID=34407 RepID=A0AAD9Y271_COLKA|nr:hypothetical protein CKAH01_02002 [Colletotrichum kahawae]